MRTTQRCGKPLYALCLCQIIAFLLIWINYENVGTVVKPRANVGVLCLDKWRGLNSSTGESYRQQIQNIHTPQEAENLSEAHLLVPNIVHYVWFISRNPRVFGFHNMVSVLSAHKILQPDVIYFHCDGEPGGEYWESVKALPSLIVIHRDPPRELFGVKTDKPAFETSDSNIARLQVVMEYGGVYLDTDVIVVNPVTGLRKYPCVLGLEDKYKVCAGVVIGMPNATFLYLWLNSYLDDNKVRVWAYNSGIVPSKLSKRYPQFVHIVPDRMHIPSWKPHELKQIWGQETFDWINHYTVHLWYRKVGLKKGSLPTMDNIRTWPGGFGELARYILFDELPARYRLYATGTALVY